MATLKMCFFCYGRFGYERLWPIYTLSGFVGSGFIML